MRTPRHALKILFPLLGSLGGLAACGSGETTPPPPDAAPPDAGVADAPAATLTLSLDPTLDGDIDSVKATAITAADLLDTNGAIIANATITSDQAVFPLSGVSAGDFFIAVNGDADDLVPTRIDDPTKSVSQRVGQKLRASMIGPESSPVYRVNTYSVGQAESPIAQFSDGTTIAGEQPYVFITLTAPRVEIKVLGTAAPLTSRSLAGPLHQGNAVPFDAWILNTNGVAHHGDAFNDDPRSCRDCHVDMTVKFTPYSAITQTAGWCYGCHYGTGGDGSGFVDPTR